ncbi:MAG: hypothetical protein ACHQF4_07990 [Sphingobacteriales bacterium]
MKQILKWIIPPLIIFFGMSFLYLTYEFNTYVERTVKQYTYTNNLKIISQVHNDYEWYANILINKKDGERLMKIYPFRFGPDALDLRGRSPDNYIKKKMDCWYYLTKGQGHYDYIIYCLNNDKSHLEIYELFGD